MKKLIVPALLIFAACWIVVSERHERSQHRGQAERAVELQQRAEKLASETDALAREVDGLRAVVDSLKVELVPGTGTSCSIRDGQVYFNAPEGPILLGPENASGNLLCMDPMRPR